jgi:hypothetical protein
MGAHPARTTTGCRETVSFSWSSKNLQGPYKKRTRRAGAWMVSLVVTASLTGCSLLGGDSYPPTSAIEPLPTGEVIVINVTFPSQGSDNDGTRVVLIGLPRGVSRAQGVSDMVTALRSRGWTKAMCRSSGDPCAIVGLSSADLEKQSGLRPQTSSSLRRLETKLQKAKGTTFMVWLGDV